MDNDLYDGLKKNIAKIILSARTISENENKIKKKSIANVRVLSSEQLAKKFRARGFGKSHVSVAFSHDDYLTVPGGIQKCLAIEEQVVQDKNGDYLHIYPKISRSWIVEDNYASNLAIVLNLNGKYLGITNVEQLINAFKLIHCQHTDAIIHSPLGHNLKGIYQIIMALSTHPNWFLWLHDYTTLCPNFHLLRNHVTFCGAPDFSSMQCQICNARLDRVAQNRNFAEFFNKTTPTILSPSEFTKDFWLKKVNFKYKNIRVIEHYKFGQPIEVLPRRDNKTLKIAYIGTPAYHKGWNDFIDLMEHLQKHSTLFTFYVFASYAPRTELYKWKKVTNSASNNNKDMRQQLIDNGIDIAFIGSLWPETFCLTAFEALAAGAFVVANRLSGNAKILIEKYDQGFIYNKLADLITYLEDHNNQKRIFDLRSTRKYYTLIPSKMTYSTE